MAMAGFSAVDADLLRKILSKKRVGRKLQDYRDMFYSGALARGVGPAVVDEVWEMILSFAGYSFCKPHSASYALVSYKSAWLRAHYPAEFLAAVLTNQGGYYSPFAYVSEARRMGLRVLLPDLNASRRGYWGRERSIRVGLMQIKGLRAAAIDAILEERRKRPFESVDDFLWRVDIDPSDARLLVKAGALDSVAAGATRPQMIWKVLAWHESRAARRAVAGSLFGEEAPIVPPRVPQYSERSVLQHELETLDFLISRHPLTLYREQLARLRHVRAADLGQHIGREVTTIGWWVTGKVVTSRDEEPMEFISFEDTSALYETTLFPEAYARFCHLLNRSRPYVLTGTVEEDFGALTMTVNSIRLLT
jgi:error-prone DNA polymerase